MAWDRTLLALLTTSVIFLRWINIHELFVIVLVATATVTVIFIFATQRGRYRRHTRGVSMEWLRSDLIGILSLSLAVLLLGAFSVVALQTF